MPHAAEQRVHHRFVAEEVLPLVIDQVGRNDRRVARIAFLHQLEEGVRLFGLEIQVSKLVDQQNIQAS